MKSSASLVTEKLVSYLRWHILARYYLKRILPSDVLSEIEKMNLIGSLFLDLIENNKSQLVADILGLPDDDYLNKAVGHLFHIKYYTYQGNQFLLGMAIAKLEILEEELTAIVKELENELFN